MTRFRVLLLLPALAWLPACGDDASDRAAGSTTPSDSASPSAGPSAGSSASSPTSTSASTEPAVADGLTLTRTDGSSVEVDGPFTVECEASTDTGAAAVRATTAYYNGGPLGDLGAYLEFYPEVVGDAGRTFELPADEDEEDADARIVFFYDGDNEISADVDGSTGTVRVVEATCEPVPRLVVEIDATIGSENDGEPVEVTGGLDLTGG